MKKLFYLITVVCISTLFASCEDDAVKLTINTSAYDVVKDLKDAEGNLYFVGLLEDGLQIRVSYMVVKQPNSFPEGYTIIAQDTRYINDINQTVSYTTNELEPGIYDVIVVSDFVKDGKEFNSIITNTQYSGFKVSHKRDGGVYNAFGVASMEDIIVDKKTEVTLNTIRKGALVTLLFKNIETSLTSKTYRMSTEKFVYNAYGHFDNDFSYNTASLEHELTTSMKNAQHYCISYGTVNSPLSIGWQGGYFNVTLKDAEDEVVELDFATNKATLK